MEFSPSAATTITPRPRAHRCRGHVVNVDAVAAKASIACLPKRSSPTRATNVTCRPRGGADRWLPLAAGGHGELAAEDRLPRPGILADWMIMSVFELPTTTIR